jgi:RNA polymerase sigma-70 factor, ECF subfamily
MRDGIGHGGASFKVATAHEPVASSPMTDPLHDSVAKAREEFLATVEGIRAELHRYCARVTGSVIEGEDIVQETLARAFYTLSLNSSRLPLRPWLFRIAHHAALDFLKSHGRRYTETRAEMSEIAAADDAPDPEAVRAALIRFVAIPLSQRSAVILKDVLGHSLEETAETMGTTVMAVKAALVRGRRNLRDTEARPAVADATLRAELARYARLFNARDWDGLRSMVSEDCRLDLVSKAQRRGKEVGMYFSRYANEDISLRVVRLEGHLVLGAHAAGSPEATYFILLEWEEGRVKSIRDYRYVPYIARDADVVPAAPSE